MKKERVTKKEKKDRWGGKGDVGGKEAAGRGSKKANSEPCDREGLSRQKGGKGGGGKKANLCRNCRENGT